MIGVPVVVILYLWLAAYLNFFCRAGTDSGWRGDFAPTGEPAPRSLVTGTDRVSLTESVEDFEETALYRDVYALAEARVRGPLARARVPDIRLSSPKITRPLTTAWFAERVDGRWKRCMGRR